jgi:GTP cyclohydrolase I
MRAQAQSWLIMQILNIYLKNLTPKLVWVVLKGEYLTTNLYA